MAAAAGVAAVLGPARPASAFLDFVIFDPAALAEHVEQVAQLAEQIESAVRQVEASVLAIKHLGVDAAPQVAATASGLYQQFESDVYASTTDARGQLDRRYPTDQSAVAPDRYAAEQVNWTADERASLAENRRLQNTVEQGMTETSDSVRRIVDASNAAPGETAAAQAHHDLTAVASGEVAKLQALRAARSRLRAEALARAQSERAYAAAQREAVRAGWADPAPPAGGLVPAFGD